MVEADAEDGSDTDDGADEGQKDERQDDHEENEFDAVIDEDDDDGPDDAEVGFQLDALSSDWLVIKEHLRLYWLILPASQHQFENPSEESETEENKGQDELTE